MKKIPLFDLNYGPEEEQAVVEVMRSGWISMGPKTEAFEESFRDLHDSAHAVAVTNCTAALQLSLRALGIEAGDEVIVPSLTFVATASSVRMLGATPVFADIQSPEEWTISPDDVARKITPRTTAIIAVHYGGFGADLPELRRIADQHGLALVEDACHAPLGVRDGVTLGTVGDAACYSFYANKNMTTGEGGMILTQDAALAERLRLLRAHGLTATAYDRERGREFYDVVDWGYNYRIDEIRAAIGIVQLEKLGAEFAHRAALADEYRRRLADDPRIALPFGDYVGASSNHVMAVVLDGVDRRAVRRELSDRGVGTSMHYPPVHLFEVYRDPEYALPLTEAVGRHELSLPIYGRLPIEDVAVVCDHLQEVVEGVPTHAA